MEPKSKSISEIADYLKEKYALSDKGTGFKRSFIQKISRALKETKLWNQGFNKPDGKKNTKYFLLSDILELESSKQMYDYLRERSNNHFHDTPRFKEINAIITKQREEAIYLNTEQINNYDKGFKAPQYDKKSFDNFVNSIMLKAIFEIFYTPINTELLKQDYYTNFISDDISLSIADVEAKTRLNNPEKSYFHKILTEEHKEKIKEKIEEQKRN